MLLNANRAARAFRVLFAGGLSVNWLQHASASLQLLDMFVMFMKVSGHVE